MDPRGDRHDRVAYLLEIAADEDRRAVRCADIAARHTAALETVQNSDMRTLHESMASLHKRLTTRHATSARLHRLHIMLLDEKAARPSRNASPFMLTVGSAAGAEGAAVRLVVSDGSEVVLASDELARTALDLEFMFAEGPGHDCLVDGPLSVAASELAGRWPAYGSAISDLGIRSVAAVPLQDGSVGLGSLIVFGARQSPAEPDLLRLGGIGDAFVDHLVAETENDEWHDEVAASPLLCEIDYRSVIHQAAGMLSDRLGYSLPDTVALLRAHAFAKGATPATVAQEVVDGNSALIED
jgi:hypothetical protein